MDTQILILQKVICESPTIASDGASQDHPEGPFGASYSEQIHNLQGNSLPEHSFRMQSVDDIMKEKTINSSMSTSPPQAVGYILIK
jgi:hypothetical protein